MPRKRRANASNDSPARKRRRLDSSTEEKDTEEVDIVMDESETSSLVAAPNRPRRKSSAELSIGGIIGNTLPGFSPPFRKGAIKRVHLQNFVTFDETTVTAVPGLNLIMGPNGTGKSSVVCAICLGLGGKPSVLGRGERVCDFIKRGESRATIEITLAGGDGPDVTIQRRINNRGSDWRIDGKEESLKTVVKTVKKLNIQVDNLCQFLAQDRVVEFARMAPDELLLQTERAVDGDQRDLARQHEKMIDVQKDFKERQSELKTVEASLDSAKEQQRGLESVISNFRTREKMQNDLKIVQSRLIWQEVEEAREELKQCETQLNDVKRRLREDDSSLRPLRNAATRWMRRVATFENDVKENDKQNKLLLRSYKNLEKKFDKFRVDMATERENIKDLKNQAATQKRKRQKAEAELENLERQFESLPETAGSNERLKEIRGELRNVRAEKEQNRQTLSRLQTRKDNIQNQLAHLEQRINYLNDAGRRRAEQIYRGSQSQLRRFAVWVESNRHQFNQEVHGPVISTMDVRNPLHAKYLNSAIKRDILYAWIVSTKADWTLLSRQAKSMHLTIRITLCEDDNLDTYVQNRPARKAEIRKLGAVGYLDETFDAPPIVKCALCATTGIHLSAYCDDDLPVRHRTKLLRSQRGQPNTVLTLYEPQHSWQVRISRYDGQAVTTSRFIRDIKDDEPGIRVIPDPTEDIDRARQAISEHTETMKDFKRQKEEYERKDKPITKRLNELQFEKKSIEDSRKEHKTLANKIKRKREKVASLSEEIDVERESEKVRKKIRKLFTKQRDALEDLVRANAQFVDIQKRFRMAVVQRDHSRIEHGHAESKLKRLSSRQKKMRARLKQLNQRYKDLRTTVVEREENAEGDFRRDRWEGKWTEDHMNKSSNELQAMADDLQSRIACVLCNEADVARYKKLEKDIASFSRRLEESTTESRRLLEELTEIADQWKPRVRDVIEKISMRFGELFRIFKAQGEVHLVEHEDFADWAVEILTNFRPQSDEDMHSLAGYRQSGGERSVSTMLYLLSLQEVTSTPFRVVDEINQGMDPVNERRIMDILNHECTPKENREVPQYFVISPKLLPRLIHSPHSAAHVIYNGKWLMDQEAWQVNSFLETQRQGAQ